MSSFFGCGGHDGSWAYRVSTYKGIFRQCLRKSVWIAKVLVGVRDGDGSPLPSGDATRVL